MGFPTKNDHFGVFWGYHHLRKHPYRLFNTSIQPLTLDYIQRKYLQCAGKWLWALNINTFATWKQQSAMLNRNKTSRNGACAPLPLPYTKKRDSNMFHAVKTFAHHRHRRTKSQIIAETAGLMKAQNQGISSLGWGGSPGWFKSTRWSLQVPPEYLIESIPWENKGHVRIKKYMIYYALGLPITFFTVDSCELQQGNTISCLIMFFLGACIQQQLSSPNERSSHNPCFTYNQPPQNKKNSSYCWWLKSCTTWDETKKHVNNGINNQPQLVCSPDFFHQQYVSSSSFHV